MSAPWNWFKDIFKWIAGAIKKIVKALIDAIKNILKDLWEWVKGFLKGVIETIKDVGEFVFHTVKFEFGKAFKKLWETIGDVVNVVNFSINTIFQILDHVTFGAFSKVWNVLSKVVSAIIIVVAAVTGHVEIALAMITTSLLAATGAVRDPVLLLVIYVTVTIVAGTGPIRSRLLKLREEISEFIHVDLDEIKWALSEGYIGWTDILKASLGDVISKMGEVLDMTKSEIWALLSDIAGSIGGTVGEVFDALKSGVDWVIENVKPLWDWVKDKVKYMWNYIGSGIKDVIEWINSKFGMTFTNLAEVIKSIALHIEEIFSTVYDWVKPKLSEAINWIAYKGKWLYNFVHDKIADVWDYMAGAVKDVYSWAEGITTTLWETVKSNAIDAWNYIKDTLKPFTTWVKETIWPTVQDISKTLLDAVNWIEQKGKDVYLWYAAHIKPHLDQVLNLIHKAAIVTEMVAAIREGKVVRALLTGIGILGGKIEEVSRNIMKFYDGTLSSIMKGIGYSIGWVRKMISDMYRTASIIAEDVAQMGINIGWDVLNEVGAFIGDVAKATLGKVYITIGDVDKTVRGWIAYLKEPVTRALAIIYQTHAEFHKYDYIYKAAYLRQLSTVTGRPFHYIYLPRVAFEGIK